MRSEEDLPICCSCRNCRSLRPYTKGRFDIDCASNENLGGVTANYKKCSHYAKK